MVVPESCALLEQAPAIVPNVTRLGILKASLGSVMSTLNVGVP